MKFKEELQKLNRKIYYYECLGSTNDEARILADRGADSGSLVIAERQNAGKGRMGRAFFSPAGSGIWMSLILKPNISPVMASMLTLIGAVAVYDTMKDFGIPSGIKWPNDVVVRGKKITGILTEMKAEPEHLDYVILGIGINVNMLEFPEEINQIATSMAMESGRNINRGEVIQRFLTHFDEYYQSFLKEGSLEFIKDKYNQSLVHMNKKIKIHEIRRDWDGISIGINNVGELIVRTNEDEVFVRSGEVSIRGVYGYVE